MYFYMCHTLIFETCVCDMKALKANFNKYLTQIDLNCRNNLN